MNTSIKTILAALAMGATAIAAQAQTAAPATTNGQPATPRVVTISVSAALGNYYRAVEVSNQLQAVSQQAQKTVDGMVAEAQAMADKIKDYQAQLQSPVATDAAKKDAQDQGMKIYQDLQRKEQDINDFRQKAGTEIQQNVMQMRQQLISEIVAKATDIGKAKGATMISDRDSLIYADPGMDITSEVVAALNQGHAMPVATGTGAPVAAPAAGTAAPAVSYPGAGQ